MNKQQAFLIVTCVGSYRAGPKTAPGGSLPPASWRSFCGCGKLIFSNSGVFMGLRETYFFVFRGLFGVLARCDCQPGSGTKDGRWGNPWVVKPCFCCKQMLKLINEIDWHGRISEKSMNYWDFFVPCQWYQISTRCGADLFSRIESTSWR